MIWIRNSSVLSGLTWENTDLNLGPIHFEGDINDFVIMASPSFEYLFYGSITS